MTTFDHPMIILGLSVMAVFGVATIGILLVAVMDRIINRGRKK